MSRLVVPQTHVESSKADSRGKLHVGRRRAENVKRFIEQVQIASVRGLMRTHNERLS